MVQGAGLAAWLRLQGLGRGDGLETWCESWASPTWLSQSLLPPWA